MKKTLLVALTLLVTSYTFAESPADRQLINEGILNENYEYKDLKIATEFYQELTSAYSTILPMVIEDFVEVQTAIFKPNLADLTYRIILDFDEQQKESFSQEMTSAKALKDNCSNYFLINEYMIANDYTLTYRYKDINNKPFFNIVMNNETCRAAQ